MIMRTHISAHRLVHNYTYMYRPIHTAYICIYIYLYIGTRKYIYWHAYPCTHALSKYIRMSVCVNICMKALARFCCAKLRKAMLAHDFLISSATP